MMHEPPNAAAVQAGSDVLADAKVLVVEDDPLLADVVRDLLETEGCQTWHAATGERARELYDQVRPDLVLLDLVLPDADGLVLCSDLRRRGPAAIVVLSGTGRHRDQALGLRLGADDFVAKPFDTADLLARIEAVLHQSAARRASSDDEAGVYQVGELVVNLGRRSATYRGRPLDLTPIELALLATFASRPDQTFGLDELNARIWGPGAASESRAVDTHLHRLRRKLHEAGVSDLQIATVRGFGRRLSRVAGAPQAG